MPGLMPAAHAAGWLPHAAKAARSALQSPASSVPVTPVAVQVPVEHTVETPHCPARQEGMQVKEFESHEKVEGGVQGQMAASKAVNWLLTTDLQKKTPGGAAWD